jgi:hypothetical protein
VRNHDVTPQIHFSTMFETRPGHGGNHRAWHLLELVERAGFAVRTLDQARSRTTAAAAIALRLYGAINRRLDVRGSPRVRLRFDSLYQSTRDQLNGSRGLVLWEATQAGAVAYAAVDRGVPLIAVPQNLESLSPAIAPPNPNDFRRELDCLRIADAVFCISREEQWLLRLWNIAAEYLPYYPPTTLLSSLLYVREQRATSLKDAFLIVGSCSNPPTYDGMRQQLAWLTSIRQIEGMTICVVGLETERLRKVLRPPSVDVRGYVDKGTLDKMLISARAVLIHQRAGVGVLTRIPEMLLAGVPVIASGVAARSAHEFEGVYTYETPYELEALMRGAPLPTPPVPQRAVDAEARFVQTIRRIASE